MGNCFQSTDEELVNQAGLGEATPMAFAAIDWGRPKQKVPFSLLEWYLFDL